MTRVRTHTHIKFANPHLVCVTCEQPLTGWHNPDTCGCGSPAYNLPCRHPVGSRDTCPSWSPVDGCTCAQRFGSVPHATPTR